MKQLLTDSSASYKNNQEKKHNLLISKMITILCKRRKAQLFRCNIITEAKGNSMQIESTNQHTVKPLLRAALE